MAPEHYRAAFAADVPAAVTAVAAVSERPWAAILEERAAAPIEVVASHSIALSHPHIAAELVLDAARHASAAAATPRLSSRP